VFAQQGLHLDSGFLDTLAGEYGAAVGLVDYKTAAAAARTLINQWVAGETHDRITDLIPDGALDELTRLVLVNAVYLHADWATPFDKDATHDGPFHAPGGDVQVPLMHGQEERGFAEGDGWKAVDLDYAGGQLAMTILVPDAGRFDEVTSHLDVTMLDAATATKPATVDLTLPKFDIDKQLLLKDQLVALGMPTAFADHRADFSGITTDEELVIDDVIHQADVTVDEKGTVAAAATAVIMRTTSAPANPKTLVVDRPFVFLLRDKATGAVVFAGQVTNPSTK
jgi:serpin B